MQIFREKPIQRRGYGDLITPGGADTAHTSIPMVPCQLMVEKSQSETRLKADFGSLIYASVHMSEFSTEPCQDQKRKIINSIPNFVLNFLSQPLQKALNLHESQPVFVASCVCASGVINSCEHLQL